MSSSSDEDLRNLEMEAHYLSQAMSKMNQRTPEWSFLNQKLEAAERDLEAMRRDRQNADGDDGAGYSDVAAVPTPSPSGRSNVVWTSEGGYRDNPDDSNGYDHDDGGRYANDVSPDYYDDDHDSGGDRRPLFDDASFEPVSPAHGGGVRRKFSRLLAPARGGASSGDDGSPPPRARRRLVAAVKRRTVGEEGSCCRCNNILVLSALALLVALSCILLLALGLNRGEGGGGSKASTNHGVKHGQPKYPGPCASFSMHLVPDGFGNETSWELVRRPDDPRGSDVETMLAGGPYHYKKGFDSNVGGGGSHYEMVHATTCLPVGSYDFVLKDARGDGICCDYGRGEYGINLSRDRVVRPLTPGTFRGKSEVTSFEVVEEDIDVRPVPESSTGDEAAVVDNSVDVGETPEGPCASFSMHLIPDQFGNETSWKVRRYDEVDLSSLMETRKFQKGTVVLEGGPYQYKKEFDREAFGSHYEMIHATTCLPVGVYAFILYDAKGDGICCNYGRGEYGVNLSKGRVIRPLSAGKFSGAGEVNPFEVTTADIDVLPALSPSTEESFAWDSSGDNAVTAGSSEDDASAVGPPGASPSVPDADSSERPCASFSMHLVPDQFGNETSWKVLQKMDRNAAEEEGDGGERPGSSNREPTYEPSYFPTSSPVINRSTRYLREIVAYDGPRRAQTQGWTVVLSGGPYSYQNFDGDAADGTHYNAIVAKTCLPVGDYKFILYDARGDGICCYYGRGEYGLNLSKGRVIRPLSSGEFLGVDEVTPFEVGEEDVDVRPVAAAAWGDVANGVSDSSPSSSSSSLSWPAISSSSSTIPDPYLAPGTTVNHVNPTNADIGLIDPPQAWQSSINGPVATSVNSLQSLVTMSVNGSKNGRGKSYGILFDVETSSSASPLVVAGMELFLDSKIETHYEIWTKSGTWQDVNNANPDFKDGFKQISHGSITGRGGSDFTKIALGDFRDVELPAGHRQAFYVTLSDNDLVYKSYEEDGISRHEMGDVVQAGKDEFKIFYGAAVRTYPLDVADPVTDFWYNAGFLGRIWYKKNGR